jgi:hypothetical protein
MRKTGFLTRRPWRDLSALRSNDLIFQYGDNWP